MVVVLVVGWWFEKSRRGFCEYTLGLFGNRLKDRREGRAVYRGALSPQCCAPWSLTRVPRIEAWAGTACL